MTNEQALKKLSGLKFIQAIKHISEVAEFRLVDWELWLAAENKDPNFVMLHLPYPGDQGRVNYPDGTTEDCLILDTRTEYGYPVAVILTARGRHLSVPTEAVDIMTIQREE